MFWGLLASFVGVLAVIEFGIVRHVVLPAFERLESRQAQEQMNRLDQLLQDDLHGLQQFVVDYANWDQMYDFVRTRDPMLMEGLDLDGGYFSENFQVNGVWVTGQDHEAVWMWYDHDPDNARDNDPVTAPAALDLAADAAMATKRPRLVVLENGFGFVGVNGIRPFQQPEVAPVGYFIALRQLNQAWIDSLSRRLRLPVSLILGRSMRS